MTDLRYTIPQHVTDVRITEVPASGHTASGYGGRIPTQYMIKYLGRWRRVLAMVYGNSGSLYVNEGGQIAHLDTDTEYRLEKVRDGHGRHVASIGSLEPGDRFRYHHDGVVSTFISRDQIAFKYHDYSGEHLTICGSYTYIGGGTAWPYVYPTTDLETTVDKWPGQ